MIAQIMTSTTQLTAPALPSGRVHVAMEAINALARAARHGGQPDRSDLFTPGFRVVGPGHELCGGVPRHFALLDDGVRVQQVSEVGSRVLVRLTVSAQRRGASALPLEIGAEGLIVFEFAGERIASALAVVRWE